MIKNLPVLGIFAITATYGQAGKYWKNGHKGLDFVADNRNVYSVTSGTVRVVAYDDGGWGQYISIGDADGRRHLYCHLVRGSVRVKVGQTVKASEVLAVMGDSGNATGVHLHYELHNKDDKVIDPASFLGVPNKTGSYNSADYGQYVDESEVSSWARSAVRAVTGAGLMQGDDLGRFRPRDPVTRQELAVVLDRLLDRSTW